MPASGEPTMTAFRLVAAAQAGPGALGLLSPPGHRTLLIVRPRALPWDLLIVHSHRRHGPTTSFRDFGREEAAAAGEGLFAALQRWAGGEPVGAVEVVAHDGGFLVRAQIDVFPLLTCLRRAGKPYEPLIFTRLDEAESAAAVLTPVLHPGPTTGQEVYFNDRHFSRHEV